ncbi:hypothetical protein ACQWHJ_26985, partial [Salmonella enterica subsp. enterica serovar Infantis]
MIILNLFYIHNGNLFFFRVLHVGMFNIRFLLFVCVVMGRGVALVSSFGVRGGINNSGLYDVVVRMERID